MRLSQRAESFYIRDSEVVSATVVEHAPRARCEHGTAIKDNSPVDDDSGDAFSILMRFFECGRVTYARGIEDGNIRAFIPGRIRPRSVRPRR